MGFDALINKSNQVMFTRFANADILISIGGTALRTIRGIHDMPGKVVSPYESERLTIDPQVVVMDVDFAGITSAHVLTITRDDGGVIGKDYKFNGKPRPDGTGMTIIYLGEKI